MGNAPARDAAPLLRRHRELLARLPVSFRAFVGVEAGKWSTMFAPEKAYLGALLESIAAWTGPERTEAFAAGARLEDEAGCRDGGEGDAGQLQEATQSRLRRKGFLPRWRQEVDEVFRRLPPGIDARLRSADAPRRLVVVLCGQGIAIQRDGLWRRLRSIGTRIPLRLEGAKTSDAFLHALFAASEKPSLLSALRDSAGLGPHDTWIVEAGESLHALCEAGAGQSGTGATGLSYARLRPYRELLARSLYKKVVSGVSGPQELAAYARGLDIEPPTGSLLHSDQVVRAFIRDVFLSGNGTLLVNNTFVEWAAVQALKRAEPRLLVARFGVRDKMKPFSSLLLFSSPRPDRPGPDHGRPPRLVRRRRAARRLRVGQRREERRLPRPDPLPAARGRRGRDAGHPLGRAPPRARRGGGGGVAPRWRPPWRPGSVSRSELRRRPSVS